MKPVSTKGLLRFTRAFVRIKVGFGFEEYHSLALRLSFLAFPHRVNGKGARKLVRAILKAGTYGRYYSRGGWIE
jgi:hypothetical protein